jgi:hypothetical protein
LFGRVVIHGAHLQAIDVLSSNVYDRAQEIVKSMNSYLLDELAVGNRFLLPDALEVSFAKGFFFNTVLLFTIGSKHVYGRSYPLLRKFFKVSHLQLIRIEIHAESRQRAQTLGGGVIVCVD